MTKVVPMKSPAVEPPPIGNWFGITDVADVIDGRPGERFGAATR